MEVTALETFVAVAEVGSITGAAGRLGRSQPTISRTIQDLEQQLGFALLTRQGRTAQLTEEGLIFEEEARRLLAAFEELDHRVRSIAAGSGRRLSVASTAAIGNGILPDVINSLPDEALPDEIQLAQYFPEIVAQEVRAGRADLGFCSLPVDLRGLRVQRVFTSNIVVAVRDTDPLASADTVSLEALCKRRVVTMLRRLRVPQLVAQEMRHRGIQPRQIIRTNVSYSALQLVQRADAVAIIDPVSAYCIPAPGVTIRRLDTDLRFVWGAITAERFPHRAITSQIISDVEKIALARIPNLQAHDVADAAELLADAVPNGAQDISDEDTI